MKVRRMCEWPDGFICTELLDDMSIRSFEEAFQIRIPYVLGERVFTLTLLGASSEVPHCVVFIVKNGNVIFSDKRGYIWSQELIEGKMAAIISMI